MATVALTSGANLEIEEVLYAFVRDEVVTGTSWSVDQVLGILGELVQEFDPKNRELLAKRASLQSRIDDYYMDKRKAGWEPTTESAAQDATEFGQFLMGIGYLQRETPITFTMTRQHCESNTFRVKSWIPTRAMAVYSRVIVSD